MRTRVIAWVCLAGVVYCIYTWASNWRNPWSSLAPAPVLPSAVTSMMPPLPAGCAKRPECL